MDTLTAILSLLMCQTRCRILDYRSRRPRIGDSNGLVRMPALGAYSFRKGGVVQSVFYDPADERR
jgi:hypothetical protein